MAAGAPAFLDTNVLIYLLSSDERKADRAESLLAEGGTVGVQVLNEFANVARRKLNMAWAEIGEVLSLIGSRCEVKPLTLDVHREALLLAPRFQLAWYDALIVGAALDAGCELLYSEDMQDGLAVASPRTGGQLTVRNPFTAGRPKQR